HLSSIRSDRSFPMKITLRKFSLSLALLLPFGVPPIATFAQEQPPEAQNGNDEEAGDEEEAEDEDENPARDFFQQFRGFGRRNANEKSAPAVKSAFREIVSPVSKSIALVFSNDE